MKVAVVGNGHLATVSSVCLAYGGHEVSHFGYFSFQVMDSEPGLRELKARVTGFVQMRQCPEQDIALIAHDTPVDGNDCANTDYVFGEICNVVHEIWPTTLVVIAAQLPVGSIAKLEKLYPMVNFACCPENLTRGNAVLRFLHPDRIVCGVRRESDKATLTKLWAPFTSAIEWMSIESAEMSKHAINAFLATSICFANEIAEVARRCGADPLEVERALKSDARIGQRAYLRPGEPYTGGTLGRDVRYLEGMTNDLESPLLNAIRVSNDVRKARIECGMEVSA